MRKPLAILFALLLATVTLAAPEPTHAVLDLGSGEDAVIGLHVTADAVREAVDHLPPDCRSLVLVLDSRGGFLAETPALAELLAKELPGRFEVTLLVREASSTAALVALAAPRLAMYEDDFLGGHTPFERMGDLDLELRDADLRTALTVAERCALLGDRSPVIARALVSPVPLSIDVDGRLVEGAAEGGHAASVLSDGESALTLDPACALRLRVAQAVLYEGEDIKDALTLSGEPAPGVVRAQAVLNEHRRAITERIGAFTETIREMEELLRGPLDAPGRDRADALLATVENTLLTHPRVGALRGYDGLRVEDLAERIEAASAEIP